MTAYRYLAYRRLQKTSGFRYHICGEVLHIADFQTLKSGTWLNDKVTYPFLNIDGT